MGCSANPAPFTRLARRDSKLIHDPFLGLASVQGPDRHTRGGGEGEKGPLSGEGAPSGRLPERGPLRRLLPHGTLEPWLQKAASQVQRVPALLLWLWARVWVWTGVCSGSQALRPSVLCSTFSLQPLLVLRTGLEAWSVRCRWMDVPLYRVRALALAFALAFASLCIV